jgi:hypothetical protein
VGSGGSEGEWGREEEEKRSEPYRLGRRRGVRRRLIETYPSIEQMFIKRKPLPAAKRAWLAGVSRPRTSRRSGASVAI